MSISRKVLLITLGFLALILVILLPLFAMNIVSRFNYETELTTAYLIQALESQLAGQEDLVLALASQSANDPEIQQAFANSDREKLYAVTRNSYLEARKLFNIAQFQFHSPPAEVFLRVHAPEIYGEDQSDLRPSVVLANAQNLPVSGIELTAKGLMIRGIVPVSHNGRHLGTTEFGIDIDQNMTRELRNQYPADFQILLSRAAIAAYSLDSFPNLQSGPTDDLFLQWSSMGAPIYAPPASYARALEGETPASNIAVGPTTYRVISVPVRDITGNIVGVIDIVNDRTSAIAEIRNRAVITLIVILASLLLASFGLSLILIRVFKPITELTEATTAIALGDLDREIPVHKPVEPGKLSLDEVGQLALSVNSMTRQLRETVETLEKNVASRTSDLERRSLQLQVAAEIVRDITGVIEVNTMLGRAANLIRQRFNYYHVAIYLLDQEKEYAVLKAGTGEAGRLLMATDHRLKLDLEGIVENVSTTGQARIDLNVTPGTSNLKNPLLPDTRSQIALPLRIYGNVLGTLDIHSHLRQAFDEEDLSSLQILADLLAIAIENARLISQLNQTVAELEQSYGRYTNEAWRTYLQQKKDALGYRYHQKEIQPLSLTDVDGGQSNLPDEALQAMALGHPVIKESQSNKTRAVGEDDKASTLAMPIKLREEVIGVLNLRFEEESIPAEMVSLVQESVSRLSLVLESARLLQEAQRLAAREQQINVIASEVRGSINLETVLQNTVRELGKAIGASRTYIHIGSIPTASKNALNSRPENGSEDNGDANVNDINEDSLPGVEQP